MRASFNAKRTGKTPRPMVARGASIPAPVEGWDAVSPIAQMKPTRAVRLVNWFPQPDWVELRRGFTRHSDTMSGAPVETLATYQGVSANTLFGASGTTIYDVTSSTASAAVTGLTNARFQFTNFATTGGNFLYMVNGADLPQYYDGASWATATITGTGIDSTDFIHVVPHKNRLWFTIKDSSDAAYLPVDSIQGAAAKFPLGGNWSLGGFLMAACSWSLDAGDGPDDYIAFISSKGQVSVYQGIDPATDFRLVGTFFTGSPIGRRCFTKVGADVALICIDGVVPLSKALIFERAAVAKVTLTERIQRVMNDSARRYKDHFGWQLISYPRGTRAILNVPISENGEQQQYVMNTLHGAWCQFTDMNGSCWEIFDERPFFGGNDGAVYEADNSGTDYGGTITADMMTAFDYYGTRGHQKRWTMCRPQLTTDAQVQPGIAFNVDFQDNAPISVPQTPASFQSLWDASLWDQAQWGGQIQTQANWISVAGLGYCASIRMVVEIQSSIAGGGALWGISLWGVNEWAGADGSEITLQVNGFDLLMCDGAFI